jgi:hypothetical protein
LKLLIIGELHGQYIENFSLSLKKFDSSIEIDIVSPVPISQLKFETNNPYKKIFSYQPLHPIIAKIPKLRGIFTNRKLSEVIRQINEYIHQYDVILIHGFWLTNCLIFSKLNRKNIFSIGAIWGSDFYKRKDEDQIFEAMDQCDLVVISTQEMEEDIGKVKAIEKNKIRNCLFGLAPLQNLFDLQNIDAKESRKILGIDQNAFVIICGYNGSPNNQHLEIISMLSDIKSHLPKRTKLIFPITYGGTTDYKLEINKTLDASGLEYIVYDKYLPDEKIAHLRKAADLMIQIPLTDAFSGSMREHLFAQNIVIAGKWLPYQSLKNKGIYYETIDNISELKEKLLYIFHNLDEIKNKVARSNTPDKFKSSLWSECIKDWHGAISEYNS